MLAASIAAVVLLAAVIASVVVISNSGSVNTQSVSYKDGYSYGVTDAPGPMGVNIQGFDTVDCSGSAMVTAGDGADNVNEWSAGCDAGANTDR